MAKILPIKISQSSIPKVILRRHLIKSRTDVNRKPSKGKIRQTDITEAWSYAMLSVFFASCQGSEDVDEYRACIAS